MQTLASLNPATLEPVGEITVSSADDVKKAVTRAGEAQPAWGKLAIKERVRMMHQLHAYLSSKSEELAALETMEMGRPINASLSGMQWGLNHLTWNLENAESFLAPEKTYEDDKTYHQVYYEPYGVFGVIAPWNFPQSNFMMGAMQPLLAGNAVVYKASEEVVLCQQYLINAWREAGLPPDVLVPVYGGGDVGEMLARSDIDFLHFTGSTKIGKHLYKIAAEKFIPVTLELGGSSAGIVFEDVALDDELFESLFWEKFINAGQICCGLKRLLIHKSIFDRVVEGLQQKIASKKIGSPIDPETDIGPLVARRQQKLLAGQIDDAKAKGAKILMGGEIPEDTGGAYYPPTLLMGVTKNMRAYNEELFGPALTLFSFTSEDEAISLANDTSYGLSAFVYTSNKERFQRVAARLEAGSISHNGADYSIPANPFGGYKSSGIGKTCGKIGLRHACRVKVTSTRK